MKLGLKLWSNNTNTYLQEAKMLYREGLFDYVELYVVPNTLGTIQEWKTLNTELNIPFTLHAPHFIHDVNLADCSKEKFNIGIFKQVREFFEELNAGYIVVHAGIEGNIEESIRQLKIISPPEMLIENKPFVAPKADKKICRGATIEEISKLISEIGCGFCLDVGHAICTHNSLKNLSHLSPLTFHSKEPYEFLAQFNALNPTCYHLSDNFVESEIDKHLHFGAGNYDLKKIFAIIDTEKNIAIETNKDSKENLNDFVEDVKWLKNY